MRDFGQGALAGGGDGGAEVVKDELRLAEEGGGFPEASGDVVGVFRGHLGGGEQKAFPSVLDREKDGSSGLKGPVANPGQVPAGPKILLERGRGLAVKFTQVEKELELEVVEAAQGNGDGRRLGRQFALDLLKRAAFQESPSSHVSDHVIGVAVARRDDAGEFGGTLRRETLAAFVAPNRLVSDKRGEAQTHHGPANALLNRRERPARIRRARLAVEMISRMRKPPGERLEFSQGLGLHLLKDFGNAQGSVFFRRP